LLGEGEKATVTVRGFLRDLACQVGYVTVARGLAARTARQAIHSLHGEIQDMPLSVRTYDCPGCGLSIDRDLNASLNILNWEPKAIGG